ncbi:MAG: hypothetical protein R3C99_25365 [Pirellulaceae bacterium]
MPIQIILHLRHHKSTAPKKASHLPDSFSVSITMQYRAIYFVDNGTLPVLIGTHADCDSVHRKEMTDLFALYGDSAGRVFGRPTVGLKLPTARV